MDELENSFTEFITFVMRRPLREYVNTIRALDESAEDDINFKKLVDDVKTELLCNMFLNTKESKDLDIDFALHLVDKVRDHLVEMDKHASKGSISFKRWNENG